MEPRITFDSAFFVRRVAVCARGLALLVLAGCSAPSELLGPAPDTSTGTPTDTEALNAKSVVCDLVRTPEGQLEPEIYMLSAMNRKLRDYPDFAAEIGMSTVVGCDAARLFAARYFEYRDLHPDFDEDQPLDPNPPSAPPLPEEASGDVSKLLNGIPALNNPVVKITFTASESNNPELEGIEGQPFQCTGTFIAKNWILTAAHCVAIAAVDPCIDADQALTVNPDTGVPSCAPRWLQYGKWTIQSKLDTQGDPTEDPIVTLEDVWALGYVHDNWIGRTDLRYNSLYQGEFASRALTAEHDVALLYIGDDRRLPPEVELDGAKRISVTQPDPTWPMSYFGWGLPDGEFLKSNDTNAVAFDVPVNGMTITGTTTRSGDTRTCGGDSGGPLVRTLNVQTNTQGVQTVHAVVGVLHGRVRHLSEMENTCELPVPVGSQMIWARVDRDFSFIERSMRFWNGPNFECLPRPEATPGSSVAQVAECWGKPCTAVDQCGAKPAFCSRPGRDFTNCATCGSGCGCIVGQCLPGPLGSN